MFDDIFDDIFPTEKKETENLPAQQQNGGDDNSNGDVWDTGKEPTFWKDVPDTLWKN